MKYVSIRWRLVLSFALFSLLAVASVAGLALLILQRNLTQRETDFLNANARAVALQASPLFEPAPNVFGLRQLAVTASFLGNAQVRITDRTGHELADTSVPPGDQVLWMAPPQTATIGLTDDNISFGLLSDGERIVLVPMVTGGDRQQIERYISAARATYVQRRSSSGGGYRLAFDPARPGAARPRPTDPRAVEDPSSDEPGVPSAVHVSVPIVDASRATVGFVEMQGAFSPAGEAMASAQRAFVLAALAALGLAVLVALLLSRGLTAPLRALTSAAGRMAEGDLAARAPVPQRGPARDEIGQLAVRFNEMASRLAASFTALASERDALKRFVADASHELRTPITALKTYNELLLTSAADDATAQTEFLVSSRQQLERLEWITHNLLDMSRLDAGIVALNWNSHDAGDLLREAASAHKMVAERKSVTLEVLPPQPAISVRCDRERVTMALSNLIENALKFTPPGGQVQVGVQPVDESIRLWVRDSGPGIPVDEQGRVFERFYRGEGAEGSGAGLGLAIVRSVAVAHGGHAMVQSESGAGSTFAIEIPQSGPAAAQGT